MNLSSLSDDLNNMTQGVFHVEWLGTILVVLITLIVTALVSALVTKLLRKVLHMSQNPLPSSSIFINIARVTVWVTGICVILSTCFNVDISAAITALGIGGIAVSLGFQSTLSNLIGGLQISLGKLVEPGDHIQVGSNSGIVHDVSWRHTVIITGAGERVLIPNSVINTSALIKLPPQSDVRLGIFVNRIAGKTSEELACEIEQKVDAAIEKVALLKEPSKISFVGVNESKYEGMLHFSVDAGSSISIVEETALKVVEEYGCRMSASNDLDSSSPDSSSPSKSSSKKISGVKSHSSGVSLHSSGVTSPTEYANEHAKNDGVRK